MTESFKTLRSLLLKSYSDLKRRLTLQLGNADLASDALQDTWVRLETHPEAPEQVSHPMSYLIRMATNSALDKLRSEKKFLSGEEVELIFESMSDPAPGPEQTAEGRSESDRLMRVMDAMPARQRRVLTLIRVDDLSRQQVADCLGISVSLVDRELKRAHEHIVEQMQ